MSSDLRIHATALQGGGPLVSDYVNGTDLSRFYTGHPGDTAAYARKAAEVDARLSAAARAAVAGAIEPLGDAAERVQRILAGDGFFVTTGQQPALFGGPLYTLYKVLAAIRLAASLERRLGRPVVALFWIGSDDHDWDEANHTVVWDAQGYARRITVSGPADAPALPMSERTWGPDVTRAVTEFTELLPGTAFSAEVAAHVHREYTPDATVAASFTATMRMLLRGRRVALVDSAHPLLRRAAAPVLQRDVADSERCTALVGAQTAALEAAGYSAQVVVAGDASNVMLIDAQGRDRLVRTRTGWRTRRATKEMPQESLLRRMEEDPASFSPNVLLRPVVENAVFPTIAYVAGPGELRYYAQIGCLFDAHGILPPVIVPRPSVTLVEAHVQRLLERVRLDMSDFRRPFSDVVAAAIRRELPAPAAAAIARVRAQLEDGYAELTEATAAIDPTLSGPLRRARNRSLIQSNEAERRILAQLKRRNTDLMEQLRRISASLQPFDAPQERTAGPLSFVAHYGWELAADVEAALDMEPPTVATWSGPHCP